MTRFKSFYNDTEDSHSLAANLVLERPGFEYGNYNFRLRRTLNDDDDQSLRGSEFEERPELIASLQSFD